MGALGFGPELAMGRGWARGGVAAGFAFGGGVLPAGASLTRGSAGTRIDGDGTLASAAADVARFDHEPVMLTPRGLLIEAATSNLLAGSERFDDTSLYSGNAVSADVAAAPDGTSHADRLTTNTVSGQQQLLFPFISFVGGQAYSVSIYLKAAGSRYANVRLPSAAFPASGRSATFDLTTGTAFAQSGVSAAMIAAGGGWWRCAITIVATASASGRGGIAINQSEASAAEVYAANGSDALLLFGGQVEAQPGATSYVATTTAGAASRAADVLTLDWGALGVADGAATLRYGFDDGSSQEVAATIAGGVTTVATAGAGTPARRWLKRVDKV